MVINLLDRQDACPTTTKKLLWDRHLACPVNYKNKQAEIPNCNRQDACPTIGNFCFAMQKILTERYYTKSITNYLSSEKICRPTRSPAKWEFLAGGD